MKILIALYNSTKVTKEFEETVSVREINEWIKSIDPNQNIATCIISRI